jgi:hypothetical protein
MILQSSTVWWCQMLFRCGTKSQLDHIPQERHLNELQEQIKWRSSGTRTFSGGTQSGCHSGLGPHNAGVALSGVTIKAKQSHKHLVGGESSLLTRQANEPCDRRNFQEEEPNQVWEPLGDNVEPWGDLIKWSEGLQLDNTGEGDTSQLGEISSPGIITILLVGWSEPQRI